MSIQDLPEASEPTLKSVRNLFKDFLDYKKSYLENLDHLKKDIFRIVYVDDFLFLICVAGDGISDLYIDVIPVCDVTFSEMEINRHTDPKLLQCLASTRMNILLSGNLPVKDSQKTDQFIIAMNNKLNIIDSE